MGAFHNIKFFVLCHSMLQLAQLLVSGYLKGSISTIEKRYGLSSQKSGVLASFNEVGNTVLIVFVSYFGSRVHRPKCIGIGAIIASVASFLIALPHFISGKYEFTDNIRNTTEQLAGLCQAGRNHRFVSSNQTCSEITSHANNAVFPILLLGQLLLGIGGVPIQPFGISYIDDYANKKNSPFYLGILFAVTVIGPALGYVLGSFLLKFYVDFNTLSPGEEQIFWFNRRYTHSHTYTNTCLPYLSYKIHWNALALPLKGSSKHLIKTGTSMGTKGIWAKTQKRVPGLIVDMSKRDKIKKILTATSQY